MSTAHDGTESRIVVGVDGSPSSLAALRWAIRQARLTGGTVDAVIAWEYPAGIGGYGWAPMGMIDTTDYSEVAKKTLSDAVTEATEPGPDVTVRQTVREGHPGQVLTEAAAGAALLVVGSRGHGGFADLLLGSVSTQCVHHASCPVLVMRGSLPG